MSRTSESGAWIIAIVFSLASVSSGQGPKALDPTSEPPVQYVLRVGDQEFPLELDAETVLPVRFDQPSVRLTAKPHRVFPHAGVTLLYPRAFTFEADIDGDQSVWTLSGNNATIMLFHYRAEKVALEDVVAGAIEQFGRENCRQQPSKIRMQGKDVTGVRIDATVAGALIRSDLYSIQTRQGSRLLWLQDALGDDRQPSAEARTIRSLIEQQLRIDEPR
jgi:hypothetical protein